MSKKNLICKQFVCNINELLNHGLVSGLGDPVPGKMCVEAAVAFAAGEDHNDTPDCVNSLISQEKIALNDSGWTSPKNRANGLRRVAIAQLGSNKINSNEIAVALALDLYKIWLGTKKDTAEHLFTFMGEFYSENDHDCYSDERLSCESWHCDGKCWKHVSHKDLIKKFTKDIPSLFDANEGGFYVTKAKYLIAIKKFGKPFNSLGDAEKINKKIAERLVQVLIGLKCEGTKYLHLAKAGKAKPITFRAIDPDYLN